MMDDITRDPGRPRTAMEILALAYYSANKSVMYVHPEHGEGEPDRPALEECVLNRWMRHSRDEDAPSMALYYQRKSFYVLTEFGTRIIEGYIREHGLPGMEHALKIAPYVPDVIARWRGGKFEAYAPATDRDYDPRYTP